MYKKVNLQHTPQYIWQNVNNCDIKAERHGVEWLCLTTTARIPAYCQIVWPIYQANCVLNTHFKVLNKLSEKKHNQCIQTTEIWRTCWCVEQIGSFYLVTETGHNFPQIKHFDCWKFLPSWWCKHLLFHVSNCLILRKGTLKAPFGPCSAVNIITPPPIKPSINQECS